MMRINSLCSAMPSMTRIKALKTCANSPQEPQTESSAPAFKGSSLGGGAAIVAKEVATTTMGGFFADVAALLALGLALASKADDDIRDGLYEASDIYGERGEFDRMYM